MKYKNIIKILEDDSNICDFFSVVFGYREVGLFNLNDDSDFESINNENILEDPEYLLKNQKYIKKIKKIKNFLNKYYNEYEIGHGFRGIFFIYKKSAKKKIINLLKKYKDPISTLEGGRDLGLLLNFPKCCVKQFYKEKIKSEFLTKLLLEKRFFNLPFAPCKIECGEKWLVYYEEIMEKLKEE